jgi:hypothetical protein
MDYWTGLITGVFLGSNIGVVIAGLLAASKRSDDANMLQPDHYPMDEAVMDDTIPTSVTRYSVDRPHSGIVKPHPQGS